MNGLGAERTVEQHLEVIDFALQRALAIGSLRRANPACSATTAASKAWRPAPPSRLIAEPVIVRGTHRIKRYDARSGELLDRGSICPSGMLAARSACISATLRPGRCGAAATWEVSDAANENRRSLGPDRDRALLREPLRNCEPSGAPTHSSVATRRPELLRQRFKTFTIRATLGGAHVRCNTEANEAHSSHHLEIKVVLPLLVRHGFDRATRGFPRIVHEAVRSCPNDQRLVGRTVRARSGIVTSAETTRASPGAGGAPRRPDSCHDRKQQRTPSHLPTVLRCRRDHQVPPVIRTTFPSRPSSITRPATVFRPCEPRRPASVRRVQTSDHRTLASAPNLAGRRSDR